jgi:hypothetical protein
MQLSMTQTYRIHFQQVGIKFYNTVVLGQRLFISPERKVVLENFYSTQIHKSNLPVCESSATGSKPVSSVSPVNRSTTQRDFFDSMPLATVDAPESE